MRYPLAGTLTLLLPLPPAVAQSLRWNLPEGGAARYEREVEVTPEGTAFVPWHLPPNAGVVLWGELDEARQRPAEPLADPRDLLAALLLDLGRMRAGKTVLDIPGNGRFRPCWLEATYGALEIDDSQTVEGRIVAPADPEAAPRSWEPQILPRLQGTLRGTRILDRKAGRVTWIAGQIELEIDVPARGDGATAVPARRVELRVADQWRLQGVLSAADPEFRKMVGEGIDLAVGALLRHLSRRRPEESPTDQYHDVSHGELALTLLALIKGGADPAVEPVASALADLRRANLTGTYALSVAILAIEALYTPPMEWSDLHSGRLRGPQRRTLSETDRTLVMQWARDLLFNIDRTVDSARVRRWHYGPSLQWDNSNTQFALLGLYAAQLCGVDVRPEVWTAAAAHLLESGRVEGRPGQVRLRGHDGQTFGGRAQPLGWTYTDKGDVTGSMTLGCLGGLIMCRAGLTAQRGGSRPELRAIDDGVRGGFLWVQDNLSVRHNPGRPGAEDWTYYYLYALERACEMHHVAAVGNRDWYFEGALQILGQQREGGGWGSLADTCFGLLFLKNSVLPAPTGRR